MEKTRYYLPEQEDAIVRAEALAEDEDQLFREIMDSSVSQRYVSFVAL